MPGTLKGRRKLLCVAAIALSGALLTPACADNESSLFVVGVLATEVTDCVANPDPGGALRLRGYLDLSFRSGYYGFLLVGSQLTATGSREQVRTETDRLALKGAEVHVEIPRYGEVAAYTAIATGFAEPASGQTPGYTAMLVQLLPADVAALYGQSTAQELPATGAEFVSRVRVFGETLGGREVTSNELAFPIIVCRGCLVAYPVTAADPTEAAQGNYRCRNAAAEGAAEESDTICTIGQDVTFPCTLCSATEPICRDPAQNPSVENL